MKRSKLVNQLPLRKRQEPAFDSLIEGKHSIISKGKDLYVCIKTQRYRWVNRPQIRKRQEPAFDSLIEGNHSNSHKGKELYALSKCNALSRLISYKLEKGKNLH